MNPVIAAAIAAVLLAVAFPYVRRTKHVQTQLLAAYLLFVGVFALVASALYLLFGALIASTGLATALEKPWAVVLFLVAVFVPAFLVARWQVRRPPRRRSLPP